MLKVLKICVLAGAMSASSGLWADYEDGVNAAFAGDFDTAFSEFSLAAEAGLDLAQYNLAILYFTGQGTKVDLESAFKWTLAAAEQGHIAAGFNVASLLYEGQGVKADRDAAVGWFTRVGKAGHADAAFALAKLYEEGEHVKKDPVLAHAWASMALANEHGEALALRTGLEKAMNSNQLSEARRLFARWQIE